MKSIYNECSTPETHKNDRIEYRIVCMRCMCAKAKVFDRCGDGLVVIIANDGTFKVNNYYLHFCMTLAIPCVFLFVFSFICGYLRNSNDKCRI